jgi:hypothetical protein
VQQLWRLSRLSNVVAAKGAERTNSATTLRAAHSGYRVGGGVSGVGGAVSEIAAEVAEFDVEPDQLGG